MKIRIILLKSLCFLQLILVNDVFSTVLDKDELANPIKVINAEILQRIQYNEADRLPSDNRTFYWIQVQKMKLYFTAKSIDSKRFYWVFQKTLQEILLESPELGKLITQNSRDNVIVSNLNQLEFEEKLFKPLKNKVAIRLKNKFSKLEGFSNWNPLLNDIVKLGSGKTVFDAFISLRINSNLHGDIHWRENAIKLRAELIQYLNNKSLDFNDTITLARTWEKDLNVLSKIYSEKGISKEIQKKIIRYGKILYTCDYFPLTPMIDRALVDEKYFKANNTSLSNMVEIADKIISIQRHQSENWRINYVTHVVNSLHSKYMIGIDLIGVGNINRLAYDKWIERNAPMNEFEKLTFNGSAYIIKNKNRISDFLSSLNSKPISRFDYGDAAIWSFDNLSISEIERIKFELKKDKSIRFLIKKIEVPLKNRNLNDIDKFISDFTVKLDTKY